MTKLQLPLLFSLFVLFTACHALVDDEFPDFEKLPVINAYLQADKIIDLQLTFTANLTDSMPKYIPNAQVIIESSLGASDTLKYTKKGWYTSKLIAKVGVTYTCKVNIDGYKQVVAQTTIPDYTTIYDLKFTQLAGLGSQGGIVSSFEFTIASNKSHNCYWEVFFDNFQIYMLPERDSVLITEAMPLTVFSNKKMKDETYKVKFFLESYGNVFEPNTRQHITIRSVDESYYKFQKQYFLYSTSQYQDLGSSPQTYPLYSNVTNGLGIFTSYTSTSRAVIQ